MTLQVYLVTITGSTTGQGIYESTTGSYMSLEGSLLQLDNDDTTNTNLIATLWANQDSVEFVGMIPYSAFKPGESPTMRLNLTIADKWCMVTFQWLEPAKLT